MPFTPVNPNLPSADIVELKRLLPHRYPILMIDRLINMEDCTRAVGIKNVTGNEPYFQGHFPDKPVMPGVLIVEAMAQSASALVATGMGLAGKGALVYFMALDKVRFRHMVVPGDQLELHVEVIRRGTKIWKFGGIGKVDGEIVAEAEFMAMIEVPEREG